jgi:hypothetical protein
MIVEYPFKECFECGHIINCPHPDVSDEILPRPVPPEVCPKKDKIILTKKVKTNDSKAN